MGPVVQGLAARMGQGGGQPPVPAPQAMQGAPQGPGAMPEGGNPVEKLAMALSMARSAIGEMGPQAFAAQGKDLLRGFVGSVSMLQAKATGGGPPPGMGGPQMGAGGPPGMGGPPPGMGGPPPGMGMGGPPGM